MGEYDDIIDLPHHVSQAHPPLSKASRAAQFSPFAALTGFGDGIAEAARLTDRRIDLTEAEKAEIDRKLNELTLPGEAEITWFVPDAKKAGGCYVTERVTIKRLLPVEKLAILMDGRTIELDTKPILKSIQKR